MHAAGSAAALGAQEISFGKGRLIASNGDVQVVFERESDGVINRKMQLAVAEQGVQTLRIVHLSFGNIGRLIRVPKGRKPARVPVIHHIEVLDGRGVWLGWGLLRIKARPGYKDTGNEHKGDEALTVRLHRVSFSLKTECFSGHQHYRVLRNDWT